MSIILLPDLVVSYSPSLLRPLLWNAPAFGRRIEPRFGLTSSVVMSDVGVHQQRDRNHWSTNDICRQSFDVTVVLSPRQIQGLTPCIRRVRRSINYSGAEQVPSPRRQSLAETSGDGYAKTARHYRCFNDFMASTDSESFRRSATIRRRVLRCDIGARSRDRGSDAL